MIELLKKDDCSISIQCSKDVLSILISVLRTVSKRIDEFEFQTRMGVDMEDVTRLSDYLSGIKQNSAQLISSSMKGPSAIDIVNFKFSVSCIHILLSALNEICNGLNIETYESLIGAPREYLVGLMAYIRKSV